MNTVSALCIIEEPINVEAIIDQVRHLKCDHYPIDGIATIHNNQDIFEPKFLEILDAYIQAEDADAMNEEDLFYVTIYTLGKFKSKAAFSKILSLLSFHAEKDMDFLGDVLTGSVPYILALCFDGDFTGLRTLFLNQNCCQYARNIVPDVITSFIVLGLLSKEEALAILVGYVRELKPIMKTDEQADEDAYIMDCLLSDILQLSPEVCHNLMQELEIKETDPWIGGIDDNLEKWKQGAYTNDDFEQYSRPSALRFLDKILNQGILSVQNWLDEQSEAPEFNTESIGRYMPSLFEHLKIGRNDPCPCDSGKKYKKCCLFST